MTDQTNAAHGTHNDEEYEDQLVWDAELDKPIKDDSEDTTMEPVKETGEQFPLYMAEIRTFLT
eukprot:14543332-Ditylum_brightwellii.AAC.1